MKLQFMKCFQNLSLAKIGGCFLALLLVFGLTGFVWAQNDVTLVVDGKTTYSKTFADSVKNLLEQSGVSYSPIKDKVSPSLPTKIKDGSRIVLRHGRSITIELNGKKVRIYTTALTVGGALKEAGIKVSSSDTVVPEKNKRIAANAWIVVRYASKIVETIQTPISFQIINQNNPNQEKGQRKIITPGKEGSLLRIYEVLSSGEKRLIGKRLLSPPVNQVVSIGIKQPSPQPKGRPAATAVASIAVSRGGSRTLTMVATAYTPGHGCGHTTATGRQAGRGIVAVDPRVIPLGTRVHISGYGTAIAADTGGAIKGNRIDVCVGSYSEAIAWGRRTVIVTIY